LARSPSFSFSLKTAMRATRAHFKMNKILDHALSSKHVGWGELANPSIYANMPLFVGVRSSPQSTGLEMFQHQWLINAA
jgi:hypothetical protein